MMIGDRIRELRIEARMTQPELAAKLEVTRSAVATYENNSRQPSIHSLIRLADIFHVSIDYLLLGNKEDSLDVSGLTLDQKLIVTNLVKNFKETNMIIRSDIRRKRELIDRNKKLKKQLEENEDNTQEDKE